MHSCLWYITFHIHLQLTPFHTSYVILVTASNERKEYKRLWMAAARRTHMPERLDMQLTDDAGSHSDTDYVVGISETQFMDCDVEQCNPTATQEIHENFEFSEDEFESNNVARFEMRGIQIPAFNCSNSSSDSDDDSDYMNDSDFASALSAWVNEFLVKQNAVDKLLSLLIKAGHKLPTSARTQLKTDKAVLCSGFKNAVCLFRY
jgi:hypothetical protein